MNKNDWERYKKYFKPKEFDSPDKKGSGINMTKDFMYMLYAARNLNDTPFYINSGYRTKFHNKKIGGKELSSHQFGEAADIRVRNNHERFIILNNLILAGFKRIGIYKTFIHCDCAKEKAQERSWLK